MQQEYLDLTGLNIKTIGIGAFMNSKIYVINIPEGVTTIDKFAFYNCNNLNIVNMPTSMCTPTSYIWAYAFSNGYSKLIVNFPDAFTIWPFIEKSAFANTTNISTPKNVHIYLNFNYNDDPVRNMRVYTAFSVQNIRGTKTLYTFKYNDGQIKNGVFGPYKV